MFRLANELRCLKACKHGYPKFAQFLHHEGCLMLESCRARIKKYAGDRARMSNRDSKRARMPDDLK